MRTATRTRLGVLANVRRAPDDSWRSWAFEAFSTVEDRGWGPVTITFQPLARDPRTRMHAPAYWSTVQFVLDGIIASGLVTDRHPKYVARLVMCAGKVSGHDGLEVTVEC